MEPEELTLLIQYITDAIVGIVQMSYALLPLFIVLLTFFTAVGFIVFFFSTMFYPFDFMNRFRKPGK